MTEKIAFPRGFPVLVFFARHGRSQADGGGDSNEHYYYTRARAFSHVNYPRTRAFLFRMIAQNIEHTLIYLRLYIFFYYYIIISRYYYYYTV